MIIVRNCFTAKPGQASKLAALLKEAAAAAQLPRHRVLTDLTGEFNRVIMEYEAEISANSNSACTTTRPTPSSAKK